MKKRKARVDDFKYQLKEMMPALKLGIDASCDLFLSLRDTPLEIWCMCVFCSFLVKFTCARAR